MIGIWCNWLKLTDRSKVMSNIIVCKHWTEIDTEDGKTTEYCKAVNKPCTCGGDERECDVAKEMEDSQDNCQGQL